MVNKKELIHLYKSEYIGIYDANGNLISSKVKTYEDLAKWYVYIYNKTHGVLKNLKDWMALDVLADGAVTISELQKMDEFAWVDSPCNIHLYIVEIN